MSELFLELFSEEIPVSLQKNIRENLVLEIKKVFEDKSIKFKKYFSLSTPNRLVVVFQNLDKEVKIKSEEIKGPSISSPTEALEGFLKSQKITKKQVFKKKMTKVNFIFIKLKKLN
jgi:glycyl-tRNA synthetase beta chain